MTLKEMEGFVRQLAVDFDLAAQVFTEEDVEKYRAKAKGLNEVADKLRDFREFLDYQYELNTGKKLSSK